MQNNLNQIEENETYQKILKDSFGGIIYDASKKQSYDSKEILKLWKNTHTAYKESSGGIMKGVFNFLIHD